MLSSRFYRNAVLAIGLILGPAAKSQIAPQDLRRMAVPPLPDTLARYKHVTGISTNRSAHVEAAIDALNGDAGLPAPLKVKHYRRDGKSVVIDMKADSLPRLRWRGSGGTVRILADGRRVILVRHN